MLSEPKLILIHLGPDEVPRFYYHAINQVISISNIQIVLVSESSLQADLLDSLNSFTHVALSSVRRGTKREKFEELISGALTFRTGFWRYALERFFVLEDLVLNFGLADILHIEGDVLLYIDPLKICTDLKSQGFGIATPIDNPYRAIASTFYINDHATLSELNSFILGKLSKHGVGPDSNDMTFIADFYRERGRRAIAPLPLLPKGYSGRTTSLTGERSYELTNAIVSDDRLDYIFDAAALGQFLGGTDPRNQAQDDRGFINEKAIYDPSCIEFTKDFPHGVRAASCYPFTPIASLHIHSKNMPAFMERKEGSPQHPTSAMVNAPTDIEEPDIITSERFQLLSDLCITDVNTYLFQRPDLFNPEAKVIVAFDEFGRPRLTKSELHRISFAKVIFTNTHLVELFFEHIVKVISDPIVLITHGSDHSVGLKHTPYLDDKRIQTWFAQNVDVFHPKLIVLPIGVANSQFAHGDTSALRSCMMHRKHKSNTLAAIFDQKTSPTRSLKAFALQKNGFNVLQPYSSFGDYLELVSSSKYVASPEGNGIDCHRTWEALYLGAVPIVDKRPWLDSFKELPILAISDWAHVTLDALEIFESRPFNSNFAKLTMGYWRQRVDLERQGTPRFR